MLPISPRPERLTLHSPLSVIFKDRIGDQSGYFGARAIVDQHLHRNVWYHLGCSQDCDGGTQPYRQREITVARLNGFSGCTNERRAIVTQADAIGGQSGGPLWLELLGSTSPQRCCKEIRMKYSNLGKILVTVRRLVWERRQGGSVIPSHIYLYRQLSVYSRLISCERLAGG